MRRRSETLDEMDARRKKEAIAALRRQCKEILAALERGEYRVHWDWDRGFCTVSVAGYVIGNL